MKELIDVFLVAQTGVPVLWMGKPGIGKSSIIEGGARNLGLDCHVEILSISEPCEVGGLLRGEVGENGKHGRAVRLLPEWFVRFQEKGEGVLFLDELTTAPPMNQAAALRLIRDRAIGDVRLPESVLIIAAANPPDLAAGGCELEPAMANRFCHLDWAPSYEDWTQGMLAGFPDFKPKKLPKDWTANLHEVKSMVASFIKTMPTLLHDVPKEMSARSGAWPSQRTWEYAAKVMCACRSVNVDDIPYLSGLVGPGAANAFNTWRSQMDIATPEEILKSPLHVPLPQRSDKVFTMANSVAAAVIANTSVPRWKAAWSFLGRVVEAKHADMVVPSAKALEEHCRIDGKRLPNTPDMTRLLPILVSVESGA